MIFQKKKNLHFIFLPFSIEDESNLNLKEVLNEETFLKLQSSIESDVKKLKKNIKLI